MVRIFRFHRKDSGSIPGMGIPSWRNRIARVASNHKVAGSSPAGGIGRTGKKHDAPSLVEGVGLKIRWA